MATKTRPPDPQPAPHWSAVLVEEIQTKRLADHAAKIAAEGAERETRRAIVRGIGGWWPLLVDEFRLAHAKLRDVVPDLRPLALGPDSIELRAPDESVLSVNVTADGLRTRSVVAGTGWSEPVELVPTADGGLEPAPAEFARRLLEPWVRKAAIYYAGRNT